MKRSSAVWTMARRNLRRSWARNLLLVAILTLAIAGDVLVGLFFTGLEAKAASLVPPTAQNVHLLVLAPDTINVPSMIITVRHSGTFYSAANYNQAYLIGWRECFTSSGRSKALFLDFSSPYLSSIGLQGRWPYAAGEVALPKDTAAAWGAVTGSTVQLAIGGDPTSPSNLTVTGIFSPEAVVTWQDGRVTRRETVPDPALAFPVLPLYPGGAETAVVPLNGAFIDVPEGNAQSLVNRILSYIDREYPQQPAAARFASASTAPIFLRPRGGPEQAAAIGRVIFAPGRKALAAGFLFVGVGIFVILLIAFIERKREFAVLKTVGMNNRMVMAMILMELGAVAAVALVAGSAVALGVGQVIARVVDYVPAPTAGAWLWAVVHTALVLVLATMLPLTMARLATVQQLLQNERLYIFRKRVTLS